MVIDWVISMLRAIIAPINNALPITTTTTDACAYGSSGINNCDLSSNGLATAFGDLGYIIDLNPLLVVFQLVAIMFVIFVIFRVVQLIISAALQVIP